MHSRISHANMYFKSGPYAASKAALNGTYLPHFVYLRFFTESLHAAASEALAVEVAPFNIRILSVLPGSIRTQNYANTVWIPSTSLDGEVPEYKVMTDSTKVFVEQSIGKQPGDPIKSAETIVGVVRGERVKTKSATKDIGDWPDLNMLVLGSDALTNIRDKCERILRNLDESESVARSIDIREE